jgi:phosphoenolpyruvate carboxylase
MVMPFDDSMEPLAREVSFLGRILGDVLREQGGSELFEAVEQLRVACRHHREYHCGEARDEIARLVEALSPTGARDVVRAFTMYFHLINMAEEHHRIRRLAERERAVHPAPRPESIRSAIGAMRTAGLTLAQASALLESVDIRPVFTAHPTEARRMTLLRQLQRISAVVATLDGAVAPGTRERLAQRLYAEVANLWQTNELRTRDRTPIDEVRNGLFYFDDSVFDVTPRIYRALRDAFAESYGVRDWRPHSFLTFGSWIGGDRDGNPNITPEVTEQTARMHKALVLSKYILSVRRLMETITPSERLTGCSTMLRESVASDAAEFAHEAEPVLALYSDEPYLQKLTFIVWRLERTYMRNGVAWSTELHDGGQDLSGPGYAHADDFQRDLELISESLRSHGGERIADDAIQDLLWQVQVFGFHLARLDVRQHRDRHIAAVDELLTGVGFRDMDEAARAQALTELLAAPPAHVDGSAMSERTRETLDVFRSVGRIQDEFGIEALDTYIVSFTTAPSDILCVLYLASVTGLVDLHAGASRLRVAPLFETGEDLEKAPSIMGALYESPVYARQLAAWGRRQEITLGYSDSDKDAGYLSSNVWLYTAQQELTAAADLAHVAVTFFHGRGGAIGRGGGPLQRAVLGQPRDTVRGRLKVTEQGEVLFTRYANPGIAFRHLEQLVHAVVCASMPSVAVDERMTKWEETAASLSAHAHDTYHFLISDRQTFVCFLEEATPLRSIMRLRIASRPATRGSGEYRLEDLRAIPWVFSWTQARWGVPGWYGLGTALDMAQRSGMLDQLRSMYRDWPFFRWVIDAAQISLGKADLGIAGMYASMVDDPAVRAFYAGLLQEEFERTVESVNRVIGQQQLLDSWPVLQRSIALRNPYVDPMSYIQVRCILELRGEPDSAVADVLRSVIDRSVTGIAAGLQNTG